MSTRGTRQSNDAAAAASDQQQTASSSTATLTFTQEELSKMIAEAVQQATAEATKQLLSTETIKLISESLTAEGHGGSDPTAAKRHLADIAQENDARKRLRITESLLIPIDAATANMIKKGTGSYTLEKINGFNSAARFESADALAVLIDANGPRQIRRSKRIATVFELNMVLDTLEYHYTSIAKDTNTQWPVGEATRRKDDMSTFRVIINRNLCKYDVEAVVRFINAHIMTMDRSNEHCRFDETYKAELTWADAIETADTFFRAQQHATPAAGDLRNHLNRQSLNNRLGGRPTSNGNTQAKETCGDFNKGGCGRTKCKFAHTCRTCKQEGHGAAQCKTNSKANEKNE
jgi:hypothetical protein